MNKTERWKKLIEDIANDFIDIVDNRFVFEKFRNVLEKNHELQKGNIFLDYIIANYASAMVSAVFRISDKKNGTISLRRLLYEIAADSRLLNKQWFNEQYKNSGFPQEIGRRDYENNIKKIGDLDRNDVEDDIKTIIQATSKIEEFRNKRIGHKENQAEGQSIKISVSFKDLYETVDTLKPMVHKYYILLTQRNIELESTIVYNWEAIFKEPWLH
jgi:hypothetical protein